MKGRAILGDEGQYGLNDGLGGQCLGDVGDDPFAAGIEFFALEEIVWECVNHGGGDVVFRRVFFNQVSCGLSSEERENGGTFVRKSMKFSSAATGGLGFHSNRGIRVTGGLDFI